MRFSTLTQIPIPMCIIIVIVVSLIMIQCDVLHELDNSIDINDHELFQQILGKWMADSTGYIEYKTDSTFIWQENEILKDLTITGNFKIENGILFQYNYEVTKFDTTDFLWENPIACIFFWNDWDISFERNCLHRKNVKAIKNINKDNKNTIWGIWNRNYEIIDFYWNDSASTKTTGIIETYNFKRFNYKVECVWLCADSSYNYILGDINVIDSYDYVYENYLLDVDGLGPFPVYVEFRNEFMIWHPFFNSQYYYREEDWLKKKDKNLLKSSSINSMKGYYIKK